MANLILTDKQSVRFYSHIIERGSCWCWTGAHDHRGYGRFYVHPRVDYAHRIAWMDIKGPIPAGLFVCHHCDNPSCCRITHLFLGSARDNTRDASSKRRLHRQSITMCPKGHPYAGDNLLMWRHGTQRVCRTCVNTRRRLAYARKGQHANN